MAKFWQLDVMLGKSTGYTPQSQRQNFDTNVSEKHTDPEDCFQKVICECLKKETMKYCQLQETV